MGRLKLALMLFALLFMTATVSFAQAADPPLVIGRDPAEPGEVIGKNFLLRIWISNVGGPGIQQIKTARVGADGTVQMPWLGPIKVEGAPIAAIETLTTAAYKPTNPQATVWITIVDRTPPAPPPPPAPPARPVAPTPLAGTAPGTGKANSTAAAPCEANSAAGDNAIHHDDDQTGHQTRRVRAQHFQIA